ncbi:MAG: ATP-binding protein [Parabacteroides sp.]|nr:ATP-binding protein [Parabacteroides sp.]
MISNLLSNAIKFTEQGSITLSYSVKDNHILFEISDTGIGISLKHIDSIFERFTKVDSFSQGTGLGLSICKTIIKALKGNIGVSSKPGKGSTFWFTLPC